MVQAELKDLFKIGVYTTTVDLDHKSLVDFCNDIEKKQESIYVSNSGFQASIYDTKNSHILDLKNQIIKHCHYYAEHIGYEKNNLEVKNIWVNINYYKDFNLPHTHSTNLISGVFYVQVPENSGNIVFKNPAEKLELNDHQIDHFIEYNSSKWAMRPIDLGLILFPSWLVHYVEPNLNKENKRISIAFNVNTK